MFHQDGDDDCADCGTEDSIEEFVDDDDSSDEETEGEEE